MQEEVLKVEMENAKGEFPCRPLDRPPHSSGNKDGHVQMQTEDDGGGVFMCQLAILIFSDLGSPEVTCPLCEGVPFRRVLRTWVSKVPDVVNQ